MKVKKLLVLFFLQFPPLLFAQQVSLVGKVMVEPPLTIRSGYIEGIAGEFSDTMRNEHPPTIPQLVYISSLLGSGYDTSLRDLIENVNPTPGFYLLFVLAQPQIQEEMPLRKIPKIIVPLGTTFVEHFEASTTLYLFGAGVSAVTLGVDLPYSFRNRLLVPQGATHVYIGTIVIKRNANNQMIGMERRDEYDQAVAELQAKEPGARLVRGDVLEFE